MGGWSNGNRRVHVIVGIETRRSLHHQGIMPSLADANRGSLKHQRVFAADYFVGNAIQDLGYENAEAETTGS